MNTLNFYGCHIGMKNKLVVTKAKWSGESRENVLKLSLEGPDVRGTVVRSPGGSRNVCVLQRVQTSSGTQPTSLLFNGYRKIFLREWSGEGIKPTTQSNLRPRSRKIGATTTFPICLEREERDARKNRKQEGKITSLKLFTDKGSF